MIKDLSLLIDELPRDDADTWKQELPTEAFASLTSKDSLPVLLTIAERAPHLPHLRLALERIEPLLDDQTPIDLIRRARDVADDLLSRRKFRFFQSLPPAVRVAHRLSLIALVRDIEVLSPKLSELDLLSTLLPDGDSNAWQSFFLREFFPELQCNDGRPTLIRVARRSGVGWQILEALSTLETTLSTPLDAASEQQLRLLLDYLPARCRKFAEEAEQREILQLASALVPGARTLPAPTTTGKVELTVFPKRAHESVIELKQLAQESKEEREDELTEAARRWRFGTFDEFRDTFEGLLDGDFRLLSSRGSPPSETEVRDLEKRLDRKLPSAYREFLKFYGGAVLEAKEDVWPREIVGGPPWAYFFGVLIFGIGSDIPNFLNVEMVREEFRDEAGSDRDLLPLVKRINSADYLCLNGEGRLVEWRADGEAEVLEYDFFELLLAMTSDLVRWKNRMKEWNRVAETVNG